MKVLHHDDERLDLALAAQQALDRIKGELAALWRLQVPEAIPLRQGVHKPENRRKQILECLVEGQQMSSGLGANRADVVTLVDAEQSFQKINDGQIGGCSAIRSGAGLEDSTTNGTVGVGQFMKQARLAHARFAHNGHDFAATPSRPF